MFSILSDKDVYQTYQVLPIQVKEQVSNYLQFIVSQYHLNLLISNTKQNTQQTNSKRVLGGLEGKIWMAPDFDEPLDDFKEYM